MNYKQHDVLNLYWKYVVIDEYEEYCREVLHKQIMLHNYKQNNVRNTWNKR